MTRPVRSALIVGAILSLLAPLAVAAAASATAHYQPPSAGHALSPFEQLPTAAGADAALARSWLIANRFPIPDASGEGRRIVYSNSRQRVWLIEDDGNLLDTYLVSGRRGVPRPGSYRVYSKSELASAGHDGITMQYMVRFAIGTNTGAPIGFHEIPTRRNGSPLQRIEDLGQFRAGCVRQSPEQALFLYQWAELGTRVVVVR